MRATWLTQVLTNAGLTVIPFTGWETRGSDSFEPVGVMWHHTVTRPSSSDQTVDRMLALTGSSTVPAPLCNYSTNRDGTISVIAAGRANHAGVGMWNGESGSYYFLGDEMKNLGTSAEPWPAVQLESARLAAAAILDHLGQSADWLCGHKEYALPAGRKVDPHSLNMTEERRIVEAIKEDGLPLTEKEENTVRDLLAALEANGAGTQASRQALLDKMAKIGKNYPTEPAPGGGAIPPGTKFTATTE